MCILDKYIKTDRVLDDVKLPVTGGIIKLRRPNNRELEMIKTVYGKWLGDEPSNAKVAAVILKLFFDVPELQNIEVEEIYQDVLEHPSSDTIEIVLWFYRVNGVAMQEVMEKMRTEDFR